MPIAKNFSTASLILGIILCFFNSQEIQSAEKVNINDLLFTELMSNSIAAEEKYAHLCHQWQEKLKVSFGEDLVYSSCGNSLLHKKTKRKAVYEYVCVDWNKKTGACIAKQNLKTGYKNITLGYVVYSIGKILVNLEEHNMIKESISGKTDEHYIQECNSFKKNAIKQFPDQLIYVTCLEENFEEGDTNKSTGLIYYY